MSARIKAASKADRDAIIALWGAAGLTRPWNDPVKDFDRAMANANSTILILETNDAIIGSIMVGEDGHRGWVYYLAAHRDHQRKGIGRDLMSAAEAWIAARDIPKSQLMVRDDNAAARGFYAALGYEVQPVITLGKRLIDHDS